MESGFGKLRSSATTPVIARNPYGAHSRKKPLMRLSKSLW